MAPFLSSATNLIRWRVWVWFDGQWHAGPVLPEGAAESYARSQRIAKAIAFEAVPLLT